MNAANNNVVLANNIAETLKDFMAMHPWNFMMADADMTRFDRRNE